MSIKGGNFINGEVPTCTMWPKDAAISPLEFSVLSKGLSVGQIRRAKTRKALEARPYVTTLPQLIMGLKDGQYVILPQGTMILPPRQEKGMYDMYWPMTANEFTKWGEHFNIGFFTQEQILEEGIYPLQRAKDVMEQELLSLADLDAMFRDKKSDEKQKMKTWRSAARRGVKSYRKDETEHNIAPFADILLATWHTAALDYAGYRPGFYRRGHEFEIHMPSRQIEEGKPVGEYIVRLEGLVTPDSGRQFMEWPALSWDIRVEEGKQHRKMGPNQWQGRSERYKYGEHVMGWREASAYLWLYKLDGKEDPEGREVKAPSVPFVPVLKPFMLKYLDRMLNSVIITRLPLKGGEQYLDKLNEAEMSALVSMLFYEQLHQATPAPVTKSLRIDGIAQGLKYITEKTVPYFDRAREAVRAGQ